MFVAIAAATAAISCGTPLAPNTRKSATNIGTGSKKTLGVCVDIELLPNIVYAVRYISSMNRAPKSREQPLTAVISQTI